MKETERAVYRREGCCECDSLVGQPKYFCIILGEQKKG